MDTGKHYLPLIVIEGVEKVAFNKLLDAIKNSQIVLDSYAHDTSNKSGIVYLKGVNLKELFVDFMAPQPLMMIYEQIGLEAQVLLKIALDISDRVLYSNSEFSYIQYCTSSKKDRYAMSVPYTEITKHIHWGEPTYPVCVIANNLEHLSIAFEGGDQD